MLLLTDLGHDPDDAIALSYLIEHNKTPDLIIIDPGYSYQISILNGILKSYKKNDIAVLTTQMKLEKKYSPALHEIFLITGSLKTKTIDQTLVVDEALIIGPPTNLGNKLETDLMFFQGGYSPNSQPPLAKFEKTRAIHSHNPCNAKKDFNLLLNSQDIKNKYFVGKNVCHGYTKMKLSQEWIPQNPLMKKFWDSLEDEKAMHDVLAAKCFLNKETYQWENAKPIWFGDKLSTVPTEENIWTLI